ncbi:DUF1566 domain-containing protein [candidate division KSB1 bacterium]|nr:DUF1566 domain-containing protein [candidate division KSB1 bacterium]
MPPDSTTFLQLLLDPQHWTPATIFTAIGALAAVAAAWFAYLPILQQRRTQRLLEKSFGSDLYSPETIERSTRYYIPPNCSSVDPAQEAEIRQVVATKEKLFDVINEHLAKESPNRHLLLLADSGMGKSSFVLNYYARNQRLRQRQRLAVVPLGIPDADEYIAKIDNKRDTVIFLDAFDEDTKAIKDHHARLLELMHACRQFKRVLITCRTQFFPRDEEIPRETGIARVGPRKAGEGATYEFWKLYLSPLSDEQVQAYLRKRYRWSRRKRRQANELVKKIPLLSVRPMLLAYIPDLLESGAKIEYAFQLYEVLVEKWLERESRWVKPEDLRQFSERLAVDLYRNSERRGAERILRAELTELAKAWNIPLDEWQLSGRSLLNRDAEGHYKFAHRSIFEYLFVKRLLNNDRGCHGLALTDLMKTFLHETLAHYRGLGQLFQLKPTPEIREILWKMLRSKPLPHLTAEEAKAMIKLYDFFDSSYNNSCKGVTHRYETLDHKGEKIVLDHATGLMWQQSGASEYMSFEKAKKYQQSSNSKRFAGFDDWRLPTLEEAMSLMEREKKNGDLYIDPVFDRTQRYIWTSDKFSESSCWVAYFIFGNCLNQPVDDGYYVRLVR